jgi:guanylate kinase
LKSKGLLVVISSPSGGGKTTIRRGVMKKHREYIFSVSATTRNPRKGEKHGRDYYFLTERQFKQKAQTRQLAEWACVHNHYYGTLKRFVNLAEKSGKIVLFDVDVQGGTALKKKYPNAVLIFLLPPSLSELKRRLRKRKADQPEEMRERLGTALKEIEFVTKYDYVVINRKIDQSIKETEEIISSENKRVLRLDLLKYIQSMKH